MAQAAEGTTKFQKTALGMLAAGVLAVSALGVADLVAPKAVPDVAEEPRQGAAVVPAATPAGGAVARLVKPVRVHTVSSAGKLSDLFREVGYELDGVRRTGHVPRLLIAALPKDLAKLPRPAQRKIMFIKSTLPLILHANEQVMRDRNRIRDLKELVDHGESLAEADTRWLGEIADRYGLDAVDFDGLLERVDIIPPSLAIAQAAEESGWGTSRFAREGNALFGQRIYRDNRPGIVPEKRGDGETYKVRAFEQLLDGVRAYVHNLNSHFAYDDFRETRAAMRDSGQIIDGYRLVGELHRYSERGEAYLETIRLIMRVNKLQFFDRTWLRDVANNEDVPPDA